MTRSYRPNIERVKKFFENNSGRKPGRAAPIARETLYFARKRSTGTLMLC